MGARGGVFLASGGAGGGSISESENLDAPTPSGGGARGGAFFSLGGSRGERLSRLRTANVNH